MGVCVSKEDCGRRFWRWLQQPLPPWMRLYSVSEPHPPSGDGAPFPSSWIWTTLWLPLTIRMGHKWCCSASEVRPSEPLHLPGLLPKHSCNGKERKLSLDYQTLRVIMDRNQDALCDSWHQGPPGILQTQSSHPSQLQVKQKWASCQFKTCPDCQPTETWAIKSCLKPLSLGWFVTQR